MSGGHLRPLRSDPEREPWVVTVCKAGRIAVERALRADPPLPALQLRIVMAVVDLTVLWSKLEDEVTLDDLIRRVGVGGKPEDQRKYMRKALRNLVELGAITYSPGNGRGRFTRVGIPAPLSIADDDSEELSFERGGNVHLKGGEPSPPFSNDKGGESVPEGGGNLYLKRGESRPPHPKGSRDLPKNPEAPIVDEAPAQLELRAGVSDEGQEPQPGDGELGSQLLAAVAAVAPAGCRHELLEDPGQAPGRAALRRRLVTLEALIGFPAAVAAVAGEWPASVDSAMAHVNARARDAIEGRPRAAATVHRVADPLDGVAAATAAIAERHAAHAAETEGHPCVGPPEDWAETKARLRAGIAAATAVMSDRSHHEVSP